MSELSKRSDLGESSSILLHFLASKSNAFLSLEISFRFAANSGRLVNSDIQQYFLQNRQSIGHFCGVAVRHFNNHYLTSTEAPFKIYALHTNPQVSLKLRNAQTSHYLHFFKMQNHLSKFHNLHTAPYYVSHILWFTNAWYAGLSTKKSILIN